MLLPILQTVVALLAPATVLWAARRFKVVRAIGPVMFCYAIGIGLGNQGLVQLDTDYALTLCGVMIGLAIPMLLFSLDLVGWLRLARTTAISFGCILLAVVVVSALAHLVFHGHVDHSAQVAGMLVGVYTGGTPNMAAIGTALGMPSELFVTLNLADVVVCAVYLPYLMTLLPRHLGRLLRPFPRAGEETALEAEAGHDEIKLPSIKWGAAAAGLAALVVGVAALLGEVIPIEPQEAVVILLITSLAIGASFVPRIRAIPNSHDLGQYLLLVFCVSIGNAADFSKVSATMLPLVGYVAMVVYGSLLLHLALGMLLCIDRDTLIITSTAAVFGPAFVGPVAMVLKNRQVFFSGMASGLVGYAAGNYLGLGLAWLLS